MSAEILRVHPDEPQTDRIDFIVSCLRKGDVVAMPTDTFYGLAVDPVNLHAVENIYRIKCRQKQKPLSLLIASLAQAYELARDTDPMLDKLADRLPKYYEQGARCAKEHLRKPRCPVAFRRGHGLRHVRWASR